MWFNNDLFRLSYLPTIIIPLLFTLFTNDLSIVKIMPDIIGWSFLAISSFLVNDYFDKDRKLPLQGKPLLALSIVFNLVGLFLIFDKIFYTITFLILINVYNVKIKGIVYLDAIFLTLIYTILPYFSLAKIVDWNLLTILLLGGFMSILIDKICDEKTYKKVIEQTKTIIILLLILLIFFSSYLIYINKIYNFLFPLLFVCFIVLIALYKNYISFSMKIVGIYTGCISMFYLIGVLIQLGKFI